MDAVPNTFPSLFWGYTVIWLVLAAYLFSMLRRLSRLEKSLQELEKDASE